MNYCSYCDCKFYTGVIEHCDMPEHKKNVLEYTEKRRGVHRTTFQEFMRHYEVMGNVRQKAIEKYDEKDAFWEVAKNQLNEKDYLKLKEIIVGRNKSDKPTRNIRRGRPIRTI